MMRLKPVLIMLMIFLALAEQSCAQDTIFAKANESAAHRIKDTASAAAVDSFPYCPPQDQLTAGEKAGFVLAIVFLAVVVFLVLPMKSMGNMNFGFADQ